MEHLDTGEPLWELVYDEDGTPERFDPGVFFGELRDSEVEDLFVFSHGWNNDARAARNLYDAMFPLIAAAGEGVATLGRIGFAGVLWPSIWFPETPASVQPPRGSEELAGEGSIRDETSGSDALTGSEIASSVEAGFARESDREAVREIGRLIDRGIASQEGQDEALSPEQQRQLIRDIHGLAQSLAPVKSDVPDEDSGEMPLFYGDSPLETYPDLSTTFGTTPPGDNTEGVGDWFRKAVEGSKDMVRVLSYTVMKHRAGTVGTKGLGRLLADFPRRAPGVRVHLIGHSFGARLVSFSLKAISDPSTSPVHSLVLVQGAFSHFAFSRAEQNPYGAGALHLYSDRVRGPLVATYSKHDYAVGRWYPKASFLSKEDLEGVEAVSRWGGMGADGFQDQAHFTSRVLEEGGGAAFDLRPNEFYRFDARDVIDDVAQSSFAGAHSDIRKVPVAQLIAAAAGARGSSATPHDVGRPADDQAQPKPRHFDVFISHSRVDAATAVSLADQLRFLGRTVWLDTQAISAGIGWQGQIEAAISASDAVLVLLSPAWHKSGWAKSELSVALERAHTGHSLLVPLLVGGLDWAGLPPELRQFQGLEVKGPDDIARVADLIDRSLDVTDQETDPDLHRTAAELEKTYEGQVKELGRLHPSTLSTLADIATADLQLGNLDRGQHLLQQVLDSSVQALGPDHPLTMSTRAVLANTYVEQNRPQEAVTLLEQVLADSERVLGPEHPSTLSARRSLANCLVDMGDLDRGQALLEGVYADSVRVLGPDHPATSGVRANLAVAHLMRGDLDRGLSLLHQTLADSERMLGPDHRSTLMVRANIANVYLGQGRAGDARSLLQDTVQDSERALGPDDEVTQTIVNLLELAEASQ